MKHNFGINFFDPNFDQVLPANSNFILQQIAEKTKDFITNLDMGEFESERNTVVREAMKVIFGE